MEPDHVGYGSVTEQYVTDAVAMYVAGLRSRGLLASRPVRIDGLVDAEVEAVLPLLIEAVDPGRVAALSPITAEHQHRVDADRATRYRNEIDAGDAHGFVLLVPHGQVPESSLNEPAFLVVAREGLFRDALARRRSELGLSAGDIEGIRQASRYRQSESIYAFLWAWQDQSGTIEANASYRSLGLLSDSALGGSSGSVIERLRRNADATDILARPGLSPSRLLDELAAKVDVDVTQYGEEILALSRWLQTSRAGAEPAALDFATWPLPPDQAPVEIRFEADLRRPPHKGWKDHAGDTVVDSAVPSATIEWVPVQVPRDSYYVVQLVEASSQQVVISSIGGKSARARRSIRWSSILKGAALLDALRDLDPAGEESGYTFVLRLVVMREKAALKEYPSEPFVATISDPNAEEASSSASQSLYHALYQFHAEQRAESPRIVPGATSAGVRFESDNGRARDASIDVSSALVVIEQQMVTAPDALGPFVVRQADPGAGLSWEVTASGSSHGAELPEEFLSARRTLFGLVAGAGPLEALDWREEPLRTAGLAYVGAFHRAIDSLSEYSIKHGALAAEDQLRCAKLLSADTAIVMVRDDTDELPILLIPPIHPASIAWLIQFDDLVWDWTRGAFDKELKPTFSAVIEPMAVGPRSMVFATHERGQANPTWWGYGGNVSGTWQCFVPLAGYENVRARDWEGSLLDALGMPSRPIGGGRMDARRVGARIKKYAVLHPYVNQLSLAVLTSSEGQDLLEALKVVDERAGTPAGAASVKEIRYEATVIGPRSPRLGRAVDAMVADPGDARWSRYATAVLDNPETVLSPGFSYARRPIDYGGAGQPTFWEQVRKQLDGFKERGIHVSLLGPMLTADVAIAPVGSDSLVRGGLSARPTTTVVTPENQQSPYQGDWILAIGAPTGEGSLSAMAAGDVARALTLAHGTTDPSKQVGLSVKLAGPMAKVLRKVHEVSDWVIIADPLFSIELMDKRRREGHETVMLDYTPEFDPYPGGRVVVTTNSITDLEAIGGKVLAEDGPMATVLSSVSARLLLALSNPTKQVVGGLRGLALTRAFVAERHPGALAIPVDGHEDMFVSKRPRKTGTLADLVAVTIRDGRLFLDVYESKYSASAAVSVMMDDGMAQARATAEVLQDEYVTYPGLDRSFRIEALRDIVLFHLARSRRHGVPVAFTPPQVRALFSDHQAVRDSAVSAAVVGWTPQGVANAGPAIQEDGLSRWLMGAEDIEHYAAHLSTWPRVEHEAPGDRAGTAQPPSGGDPAPGAPTVKPAPPAAKSDEGGIRSEVSTVEPEAGSPPVDGAARPSDPQIAGNGDASPEPGPGVQLTDKPVEDQPVHAPKPDVDGGEQPCVRLGSLVGSGKPATWCPPLLSNGHLILIGGSGAGKTTALRHITAQIRAAGVPVLILDFHGDITPVGTPETLYRFEYAGNSVHVNPFHLDPRYNLIPIRLRDQFIEAWKRRYYSMGIQQYNYLVDLIDEAFAAKGITANPQTWTKDVDFSDVIAAFERSDAPDATKEKIRAYIRNFSEWQIFHGGTGIAIEQFLDESCRLDMSQLDENARGILADVVLRRLFLLTNALGPLQGEQGWAKFRAYVVIDEAQILMGSQGDAKASLSRYTAEARKFGIGLILATQLKDNVPEEIWGNVDTRLFMQALDPGERARNAKAAGVPEETLRTLSRGEAILMSSSQAMQRPVRIKIEPDWLR
jgi:hypothetical protein